MIVKTLMGGVTLLDPEKTFSDARGVFIELMKLTDIRAVVGNLAFVQTNVSHSAPHTIRGLHYQTKSMQGKLLYCVSGSIFQVSVDVRKGSKTFGESETTFIDSRSGRSVYVPPGFANGFLALEKGASVVYQMTDYYRPERERCLYWNDPQIGIKWPLHTEVSLKISKKDREAPRLDAIEPWEKG